MLYMYSANTESRLWQTPRPLYESHRADGYIGDEGQSELNVLKVDNPGGSSDKATKPWPKYTTNSDRFHIHALSQK